MEETAESAARPIPMPAMSESTKDPRYEPEAFAATLRRILAGEG